MFSFALESLKNEIQILNFYHKKRNIISPEYDSDRWDFALIVLQWGETGQYPIFLLNKRCPEILKYSNASIKCLLLLEWLPSLRFLQAVQVLGLNYDTSNVICMPNIYHHTPSVTTLGCFSLFEHCFRI